MRVGRRTYVIPGAGRTADGGDVSVAVPPSGRLVVDPSRCAGCRDCEMVCALGHEGLVAPSLARLVVVHDAFADDHPDLLVCPQCTGPECMFACPRGAIVVDAGTGARVVDEDLCDGCGLCVRACHLGMIRLHPRNKKAFTCDLCDGAPLCVSHCPQRAIRYRARSA